MTPEADNCNTNNPVDAGKLIHEHGPALHTNGIAIVLYLATRTRSGEVEASYEEMAAALGSSRPTVIREMKRLERLGFVFKVKKSRANECNIWALSDPSIILTLPPASTGIKSTPASNVLTLPGINLTPPSITVIPPEPEPASVVTRDKGTSPPENIEPTPLPPVEEGAAEPPPVIALTANEAYHELTNRNLPNEVRPKWDEALARHGVERMREVVVCWRAAGFSPTNHKGQLDWMRRGVPAKHRLDSDEVYEAKDIAADLGAKGNGNGFTTKTDRNRDRLREVAEDIAGLRNGDARSAGEDPRDCDQRLLGDGTRGAGSRGAGTDRLGVGGDCGGDPDLEVTGLVH